MNKLDPAYKYEQEVRLLIMGTPEYLRPHITTRFRSSEIVPYIAHPMPVRGPHNIAEIIVGPAAPSDAERTLRRLLSTSGIDPAGIITIEPSRIPYARFNRCDERAALDLP
jgi:hypothetical protein